MARAGTSRTPRGVAPVPSSVDRLWLAGWSHHTSPLAVLERVSLARPRQLEVLAALVDGGCTEAVVLSTCSRTEVYAAAPEPRHEVLLRTVARVAGAPAGEISPSAELRSGADVVEHLFLVTAGLRSRVLGEGDVRGQVRRAVKQARTAGLLLPTLGPLFATAARCADRVADATGLGARARSLGLRAVDVGLARVRDVDDPDVLVVGAGEMARTAVEHLDELGRRPRVAARCEAQALPLAGPGSTCPLAALAVEVARADLLICATSAPHDVVTLDDVRQAMSSGRRPLTVVDLSVPRNVDVAVSRVAGVELIDVGGLADDLGDDDELRSAVTVGSALVRDEAARYVADASSRTAGPLIAALRAAVEELGLRELADLAPAGSDPAALARAAHGITGKLLHRPTLAARAAAASGDGAVLDVLAGLIPPPRSPR